MKDKVIDLAQYRAQKEMIKLIQKLDGIADYVYENYNRTEQQGYENFKRLLDRLDAKYDQENSED